MNTDALSALREYQLAHNAYCLARRLHDRRKLTWFALNRRRRRELDALHKLQTIPL